MNESEQTRQEITAYIRAMLGDGMVDVELDPIHYNTAIDRSLAKYRQRSANSVEESFSFLTLETDKNDYILPAEVMSVREVFRRSIGSRTGGGDGGTDGDMSETITCGGVTLSTRLLSATKPPLPSLMLTEAKGRAWIKVSISWTIPEYPSVTTTAYTTFGNGGGGGGGADGGRCKPGEGEAPP